MIHNFGTDGIRILNGSRNNEISNCSIYDIASCGIWVGSMHGHSSVCPEETLLKDNVVYNNYITRVGLEIFDSSGIAVLYTENTVVDHNEVCYTPYTGITLGWGYDWMKASCRKNNKVSNNYVHNTGLVVHDGASIYTLGDQPGSKIYGNYVHTHNDGSNSKDAGLYLDEGTVGIELYNNVVGSGVYWWSTMWTSSIQNNYWHDNYYQINNSRDNGINNRLENNTYVEDGDFGKYPVAQAIIDQAGLVEDSTKVCVTEGISPKHNISLSVYEDCECYYFTEGKGISSFRIPDQIGSTQYNWLTHQIKILMPEGTDVTALVPMMELESGYAVDKASGTIQDFTNPVSYVLSKGEKRIVWTVKVSVNITADGMPNGTEIRLNDAIADAGNWTVAPVTNSDGSVTFIDGSSVYIGERYAADTILEFDMSSNLNLESKDWLGYALRMQEPSVVLGTMYHICFNNSSIEVQKWVRGHRTMLYGTTDGFTPVYGNLPNDFYTANERHSIKTGAIEVSDGVRLFLYIDGNKIFDIVDADDPITENGYFAIYPITQDITLMEFSDIRIN